MRIDPLLINYPIRIREVSVGVVLLISLIFYIFPKFLGESEKMDYIVVDEIDTFDIPQTEQIKLPEPPSRPSIPIASEEEDFDEDITIDDTDFDDFEDWDSAPPPPGSGPKVRFVAYDKAPTAIVPVRPFYPEIAKENELEGTVHVQFFVDIKGNVSEVSILKSTAPSGVGLDEAAVEAVKRSKWKPAQQRDKKVGVWLTIPVTFTLN